MLLAIFAIFFIAIGGVCASDTDNVSSNVNSENGILNSEGMNVASLSANIADGDSNVSNLISNSEIIVSGSDVNDNSDILSNTGSESISQKELASDNSENNNSASLNNEIANYVNNLDSVSNNDSYSEIASNSNSELNLNNNAVSSIDSDVVSAYSTGNIDTHFVVDNYALPTVSGQNFTVTLLDSDNRPVIGMELELVLKNIFNETKSYWRTTNTGGIAKLVINLAQPSEYSITPKWGGYANYNAPDPVTSNITIYRDSDRVDTIISGSGTTVVQGGYYNITLTDANKKPLANEKINYSVINLANQFVNYTGFTDKEGILHIYIGLIPATWTLNYSFAGSAQYRPSNGSSTIVVSGSSNNTNVTNKTTSVSISDIGSAASDLKTYAESHEGNLPYNITINGEVYTLAQFLYMLSSAVNNINNKNLTDLTVISVSNPSSSTGDHIQDKLLLAEFNRLAVSLVQYMDANGSAPVNVSSSIGNIQFNTLVYTYAKVMAYYKNNNALPNYSFAFDITEDYYITIIAKPSTANSGYDYAWYNTTFVNYCPVCGIYGTLQDNPKGVPEGELTCCCCDADFDGVTGKDKRSSSSNNYLTKVGDSILVNSTTNTTNTTNNTSVSIKDIMDASSTLKEYVDNNKTLPSTIKVGNVEYTMAQFTYLMAQAIVNLNGGSSANINVAVVKDPSGPSGDTMSGDVNLLDYVDLANRIATYINTNGQAPNYGTISYGKASYNLYDYAFAKILIFYKENGSLPNYCLFDSSVFIGGGINGSYPDTSNSKEFIKGINEVNTVSDLSTYLVASGYSAINSAIQSLANSLTAGLSSDWDKASAIFNYVRDEISYSYYANSKYGASGTLTYKAGNCCDQANLVVALCRAAGLYARYSHGQGCTFSSGLVTGHVWAQIYVDGVWYAADATSYRNSLGDIVNWNVNSFYSLRQYALLPF